LQNVNINCIAVLLIVSVIVAKVL